MTGRRTRPGLRDCTHPVARHVHGTRRAYLSDGCGCDPCTAANSRYHELRYRMLAYGRWDERKLVRSIGSARRLQALMWNGWSLVAIGARIDANPANLQRLFDMPRITTRRALAIAAVYDELWDVDPPRTTMGERMSANRTAALARRRRYVPPLGWDDDTIDDPAARPLHRVRGEGAHKELRPCGTHAAFVRHQARGEAIDAECAAGQLEWNRERMRRERAARAGLAVAS